MRQPSPKSVVDPSASQGSFQQNTSETASSQHPPSTFTPSTSSNSVISNATTTTPAEKAASQDAEDFFARAKAMGLNLTRQDYERARAGVSAFLKAQRVDKTEGSPNLGEGSGNGGTSNVAGSSDGTIDGAPGSAKLLSQSKLAGRSTSSPMLSFFTAVVPTEDDTVKARPSLDDVGALEEKKRRKERRRRLRERRERLGEDPGKAKTSSTHIKEPSAASTLLDGSPHTISSVDAPGDCLPSAGRLGKVSLLSHDTWPEQVGLGLQMGDGHHTVEGNISADPAQRWKRVVAERAGPLQSPKQLSKQISAAFQSPGLLKMSQKAHIDMDGKLTLMATPDHRQTSEDEDIVALTNTGAETDDSGVFLVAEPTKKDWISQRRPSSNDTSPLVDLHESLDRMSFLDRVMAQKRSPVRLKKEAKAREREAKKNNRQADLVVMTATTTTTAPPLAQSALQPLPRHRESTEAQLSKSVRWANNSSSPRQRMTTKEHYDFAFYGIAPNPADMAGNLPTFYEEEMKRNSAEAGEEEHTFHVRQRTVSNWMKPHLGHSNMGSPVAMRSSAMLMQDSPGIMSLGMENMPDALGASSMSAKRGLLFGPSTNVDRALPTGTDHMDAGGLFSHGPTLSRSPARNILDSFTLSTPTGMTRSVTALAAPFSFHQAGIEGDRLRDGVEESPDRVMLMRAHSSGALERRKSGHLRQTSLLAREIGKEDASPEIAERGKKAPAGWAHRSPMGKADTISPAAIFGMTSSQQRIRVFSGEINEMERLPLQSTSQARMGQNNRGGNSDEEGDDERELDGSPGINGAGRRNNRSPLQRSHFTKEHARDSSASTSAFEGSPMYLDIHNRTASIVNTLPSSSNLVNALGLTGEEASANAHQKGKTKKKKKAVQEGQQPTQLGVSQVDGGVNMTAQLKPTSSQDLPSDGNANAASSLGRLEWDKPDGTRVVKLISEELQAALESGSLPVEPPARYYKLPPEWGQSKSKPLSVSYAGMIGQALLSSSDGRLSLNEIYNWISTVFPFFERGDRGWQNSIRHNLSLNKSFIKVEREAHIPGKGGWWAIKHGHEDRFRGGSYIAPGSALSQKVGPKTPKTSFFASTKENEPEQWTPSQPEEMAESDVQMLRRKRQESDGRSEAAHEHASDSDYLPSNQGVKPGKKSKKVKLVGGMAKKGRSSLVASSPAIDAKQSEMAPLQKKVPLRPVQSSSPQDASYDSITPHRAHQFVTSSGHGSTSTTSMMASMPMLTDASSPPSSPNAHNFDVLMPPPSGGIQGAASSHSARKRKQSVNRAVEMMNTGMMQQHSTYAPQNASVPSSAMSYSHLSSHTLQASPLAHMRANNGSNVNGGSSMVSNARLRAGPGHSLITAMESPLRRHSNNMHGSPIDNSPSRLFVNSPISSMRGLQDSSMSMERSTTGGDLEGDKENQMPGPQQRGSPGRLSGQFAGLHQQHSFQNSAAGMNLQTALGPAGQNTSQYMNFVGGGNTPTRYNDQNNGNFIYQRWGLSPSPGKGLRYSASTPNMYSNNGTLAPQGHGSGSNGLDDPFDYSGNLQHELEMTAGLAHFDGVSESPMKMAYPQAVRNQFFNGQVPQPLQQSQQQLHYLPNGAYPAGLAASQVFGYRETSEH